jgi:hypothetical protein
MTEVSMSRCSQAAAFAVLSVLWCGVSASAETLRCASVNGNVNCAGSGGVSCQTVDGKKVCVSGHGDVVQSFGNSASPHDDANRDEGTGDDEGLDGAPSGPTMRQRLEQHGPHGRTLLLQRDGASLHFHNDWLSIDRD